jgi:hypothetical protein
MTIFTRENRIIFSIASLVTLFFYSLTVAKNITTVDSGELALAIKSMGVAHPPGAPLYVLVGQLGKLFPFANLASNLAWLSALFSAATAGLVALIGFEFLHIWRTQFSVEGLFTNALVRKISILLGCAYGVAYTPWFYASVIEVYALSTFLLFLTILCVVFWGRNFEAQDKAGWKYLYAGALIIGLGCGVHHLSMVLAGPAIAWFCLNRLNSKPDKELVKHVVVAFAIGISVFALLPVFSAGQPLMNWGQPDTMQRFYNHITAKIYQQGLLKFTAEEMREQFNIYYEIFKRQFGLGGIAATLAGLWLWSKSRDKWFTFCAVLVLFNTGFWIIYNFSEDKDGYLYLTVLVSFLCLLRLAFDALRLGVQKYDWLAGRHIVMVFLILIGFNLYKSHPIVDKSKSNVASLFVKDTMDSMDKDSLFLSRDWQFWSPYLYMRHEENFRPDVTVISTVLMRQFWYVNGYLRQVYPEMVAACKEKYSSYLVDLEKVDGDYTYPDETMAKLFDLMIAFVNFHEQKGHSIYSSLPGENPVLKDFTWVPEALSIRLVRKPDATIKDVPPPELHKWLLGEEAVEDVIRVRVVPHYAKMYLNRARYLYTRDALDASLQSLGKSMALDGESEFSLELLGDILLKKGDVQKALQAFSQALQLAPGNEALTAKVVQLKNVLQSVPAPKPAP